MSGGKLQLALRELQGFARSVPLWLTFAAIVALFTVTGPYRTSETMSFGQRLGFWLMLHTGTWACAIVGVVIGIVFLEGLVKNRYARTFIGAVAATPAIGLAIMLVNWSWGHSDLSWSEFGEQALSALPLTFVFSGITILAMRGEATVANAPAIDDAPAPPARSSLLDRLKPENRGTILHLEAQDHYTSVTTRRGRELVLIRFSDALNEIEAEDGLQVHRSHWVARENISNIERAEGKVSIVTQSGVSVPVSRTRTKALSEWYDGRA